MTVKHLWGCILACLVCLPAAASAAGAPSAVVAGERLSDWLLRNPDPAAFAPALQWRVPSEKMAQHQLRQSIVQGLQNPVLNAWPAEQREVFTVWMLSLPLTGRLTVAIPDARWLQAAPDQDPVLLPDHTVVQLGRPHMVTVLSDSGLPCAAVHAPGALLRDYVQACMNRHAGDVDEAWLVQPDGRSTRFGIAPWNGEPQDDPAPGAWVWAPRRQAHVPAALSDGIARFLATQLPGELTWPSMHVLTSQVQVRASGALAPRALMLSASDWGEIGLIQTPTARMAPGGDVRVNVSAGSPYVRINTMFQRFDWLEGGFRYTDINNVLYGPSIAGDQTYKDKSLDVKIRLAQESPFVPELAFGVRDLGGTGLFSAEYLVANKRFGSFDWSLGLGWGYLGSRNNVKNPLTLLGDSYSVRPGSNVGQGGTVSGNGFLRGPAALFGGVQWQSPSEKWAVKLELDANDYQHEPFGNTLAVKTPLNLGAVYRLNPNLDVSLALERGERFVVGLTLHGGLSQLQTPKVLDPRLPGVLAQAPLTTPVNPDKTVLDTERFTGWSVRALEQQGQSTRLIAETDGAIHLQERVERAIRVLHRDSPASSRTFDITLQERGLPLAQLQVDRAEWVARHIAPQPPSLRLPAVAVTDASAPAATPLLAKPGGFDIEIGPSFSQILGGPNAFVLYQLGVQGKLNKRFTDSTWLSGGFNARLLDNYSGFTYDAPSDLPRVRTYQREYVTSSQLTLPELQLTHVRDLGGGHYASVYGGLLESMYGGVGAEWLYRPWRGPISVGMDINRVRQRGFNQDLAFRDYTATTGHATLYWDTGWQDLHVKLSLGQYLAQDVGATLDLQHTYPNGVTFGAYATKTNVSAEQFGEGSFDKGIYIKIPFDVMMARSTPGVATLAWSPLTRDGGARLQRAYPLYDLTRMRDRRAFQWGPLRTTAAQSAEYSSYPVPAFGGSALAGLATTTRVLGQQLADIPASTWLWGGGAIFATSLADKSIDQWAQDSATGPAWDGAARVTNAIPVAMALGTGLLATGMAGDAAAQTATIALQAAGFTLAGNLATRWVVGRARPYEEMGPGQFNGMQSGSASSGFASNHMALAFALATPFAQRHNMPWLYAVAGSTALGRIQQREHWASDTLAGALMGYTIGSLVTDQQTGRGGPRWAVTPQSVNALWSFR